MTELKDVEQEVSRFRLRLLAAALFVLLAFGLLAARLVHLQVFRHDELATQAEANRIAVVPIVPNRGLIVDRNGVVLATNYSAYTLELAPQRGASGAAELEALIDELATVVEIGPRLALLRAEVDPGECFARSDLAYVMELAPAPEANDEVVALSRDCLEPGASQEPAIHEQ